MLMRSAMAEELKIVNDCMTCFSEWGVQKRVKECRFIEYWILVLENCNFPWKTYEKSMKFVCLKLYEPWVEIVAKKKTKNKPSEDKTRTIYERGGGPDRSLAPSRFWHHFVLHNGTIRELSNNEGDGNGDSNKAMSLDWHISLLSPARLRYEPFPISRQFSGGRKHEATDFFFLLVNL